ncbi:MAG: hypothetical protein ACLFQW_13020 [Spirochaetaceae bacterium]
MTFQLIVSFLTLLLFVAALVAPLVYMLYKQKQGREENTRRQAAADRGEGEVERTDPSLNGTSERTSERTSGKSAEESYQRYSADKGYRVESRPSRVDSAGREVYSTPYSDTAPAEKRKSGGQDRSGGRKEKGETLSAHTKEFSSHALSSSLDERYNRWDEMSRDADSWNKPAAPFGEKAASPGGGHVPTPGNMSAASGTLKSGTQTGTGFRRVRSLPELKRALVMSQILGPPKALELENHPGYGEHH